MKRVNFECLPDVQLAKLCESQSPLGAEAATFCRKHHEPALRVALQRMRLEPATIDDVLQQLWTLVFVGEPETHKHGASKPLIATFEGRGKLGAWLRVTAVRLALRRIKESKRYVSFDAEVTSMGSAHEAHPEQNYARNVFQREFKRAFQQAMGDLSSADRDLLRRSIMLGQSIDEIAVQLGTHRATAARQLARARNHLMKCFEARAKKNLNVTDKTYRSIAKQLRSHLELSLGVLLSKSAD